MGSVFSAGGATLSGVVVREPKLVAFEKCEQASTSLYMTNSGMVDTSPARRTTDAVAFPMCDGTYFVTRGRSSSRALRAHVSTHKDSSEAC